MASISKMSICGIRSFSPDAEETIEFYSPLTMIVGANGCGKTTIIESLKFACTGSLPPNAKSGQVFVNDPGVTDTTEVKASIKLRFRNKRGHDAVVTRSLQVTKKKSKLEYRAVDGVIRYRNEAGETVSLSHKCGELDKQIPELLGVSAAVMESVIFCHQEDSSWPLAESAVLKKKFDDIFESSRFARALEVIAKTKKDYAARSKDLRADVVELAAHQGVNAENLSRRDDCLSKQEQCDKGLARIAEQSELLEDKASRASAVVSRGQAGQEELRGVEQSASHLEIRLREKSLSLERVLDLSDAAIEFQLRNFEAARAASSEQLLVHGRAAEGAERRLQALREGVDGLNTARGEARSAVAALEAAKSRHQETSSALARKFSLRTLVPSWEPSKALELSAKLAEKEGLLRAEAKTQLAGLRADCEAREERQGRLREALQKLSLEGAAAERDMARVQRERDQCRGEQSRLVSAKDELAQAENKLQAAKTALSELQSTTDLRRTQTELAELSSRIKELGQSIAQDAELLRDMAHFKEESDRLQLALKQSDADLVAGTSDAALLFERNYELMGRVGQTSAPASLADLDSLVAAVNAAQRETREALAERKKEARDLNERTAQLTLLKDQIGGRRVALTARLASQAGDRARLKKLASELNDLRAYFMPDEEAPLGEGASLKEMEATAEEVVEIAQEVFYSLGTRRKVYEKFEKARERSSACPCCKRDMSEREEGVYKESVAKFFQKKHFENMSVTETHTARAKEVLGLVRGAGGALADADAVEAELRQSSELEAQYDRDSNAARVQEKEKAGEMRASEETAAALDHLLLEVHALRRRLVETTERRAELRGKQTKQSQSMASTHLDGRDYAAIDEAVRVRVGEREALQLRKDALQGDDSRASARLYAIKTRVGEAEKELLEAATHFEKLSALQTRFSELDKSFRELSADRTAIASKASAMQPDLRDAEEALKLAREGLQRAEEDWGVRSQLLKRDVDELARCSAEVELLRKRVESTNLEALERELADAQRSIDAEEEAIKGLQQKASQIQQELSSEERTRKELQDNLDVRALSAEYEGLKARLRDLRAKHEPDAKGVEDARRELQRCAQERQRLATEEATIRGRLKEVHEQTAEVNGKLGNPTYRNIAERHRKKNIEYETTLMAVSDLDSYYHALDGALATYHLLKIKEINKIIRELWQQVYRGDDIDRIEISSESEAESGAATKKSYNYRVVMTKGSVPLDMRGRCSAGQRVLAAIVIRLALAETFCLSCGMLALDEPTTNLDDANRAGLAHALARIISTRSKQLNFQLVCITHDETFVRLLSNELSMLTSFSLPDYYFRVARKEDQAGSGRYFSSIERIAWEDM